MLPRHYFEGALYLFSLILQLGCANPPRDESNKTPVPAEIRLVKKTAVSNQATFEIDLPNGIADQLAGPVKLDPEDWDKAFHLKAETSEILNWRNLPSVQGSYRVSGKRLIFEPIFPLQPAINYHATFNPSEAERIIGKKTILNFEKIETTFRLDKPKVKPSTVVTEVYPTADILPENLLKFYIHFSSSMSQGNIYRHIHLQNSNAEKIELPFLELGEELWNPDGTRLTLLFDPGRIKQGLLPREQDGPVLNKDNSYTLKIESDWPDASGTPLREGFSKSFSVTSKDVKIPSPDHWKITAPDSQSKGSLTLTFPEPLDHALIRRLIWIESAAKETVEGTITIQDSEKQWKFTPEQPWEVGNYRVVIGTNVEDLAGNTVTRPFEVDRVQGPADDLIPDSIILAFKIER